MSRAINKDCESRKWSCLVHVTNLDGVESFKCTKSTDVVNTAISQTIRIDCSIG